MFSWLRHHRGRGRARHLERCALRVESLEERTVPAEFTVTTTADGGPGSLRQALLDANATPELDLILVPAGTYTLTRAGADEDLGATGDLDIRGEVWIQGDGAQATVIDGNGLDRVFHVHGVGVALVGLAITGGRAAEGGGLRLEPGSDVAVLDGDIRGNQVGGTAAAGGGVYVRDATLGLYGTDVRDNAAVGQDAPAPIGAGGVGRGGGVYLSGGQLVVYNTSFYQNSARGGSQTGTGHITGEGGGAGEGGGLYVLSGSVWIADSFFANNGATGGRGGSRWPSQGRCGPGLPGGRAAGGGLYIAAGQVELYATGLGGNSVTGGNGGPAIQRGPPVPPPVGCRGGNGGAGSGGGLYVAGGDVLLQGSWLTDNQAQGAAGGPGVLGGGTGSTGAGVGGGVYIAEGARVCIDDLTFLAKNRASTSHPDVFGEFC